MRSTRVLRSQPTNDLLSGAGLNRWARFPAVLALAFLASFGGNPMAAQRLLSVNGSGSVFSESMQPAMGAVVSVVNSPPDAGRFETRVGEDGRFSFSASPLTESVTLQVSWDPFYRPAALDLPREQLVAGDLHLLLDPVRVDIVGRVALGDTDAQLITGATLFAVAEHGRSFLGASGPDGVLRVDGVPVELFGDAQQGVLVIRLPDALTLAGRFIRGPETRRTVVLDPRVDLGTVQFQRLPPPAGAITLAGVLYVQDSLDPERRQPVEGLQLLAVEDSTGAVAARTTVTNGSWSVQVPAGTYRFEAPNARDLGFAELDAPARPIMASRRDLKNGLGRPVPRITAVEGDTVEFTYRLPPDLTFDEVVLRVGGNVLENQIAETLEVHHYRVRSTRSLASGLGVEVAVRIRGLLTRFSPAVAMAGGAS